MAFQIVSPLQLQDCDSILSKTSLPHISVVLTLLLFTLISHTSLVGAAEEAEDSMSECVEIVSIGSGGMSFEDRTVEIELGQTVCWIWTNETMAHNVAQTADKSDTTRMEGGVYSGEPNMTVDFRHKFMENQTFYYICEPHASVMKGVVIVGSTDEGLGSSSSVPSFSIFSVIISLTAAAYAIRCHDS